MFCKATYPGGLTLNGRVVRCDDLAGHIGQHGNSFAGRWWDAAPVSTGETHTARGRAAVCGDCWYVLRPGEYLPEHLSTDGDCSLCGEYSWGLARVAWAEIDAERADDAARAEQHAAEERAFSEALRAERHADEYGQD